MIANNGSSISEIIETQGPCTAPLDSAAEYIRSNIDRVFPLYVFAMAPHAVAMIGLIDAIIAARRSTVAVYCWFTVAATVWRWIWLSRLQYAVDQDLHRRRGGSFWRRLPQILLVRIWTSFAIIWGGILIGIPAFYGLLLGSFATPLLVSGAEPVLSQLASSLSWIQHSAGRLFKVLVAIAAIGCLLLIALFAGEYVLAGTVLPSILGINTAELQVTVSSWAWRFRVLYFVFLALDMFWAVASVILFYDSQSRRMATDLRVRLSELDRAPG